MDGDTDTQSHNPEYTTWPTTLLRQGSDPPKMGNQISKMMGKIFGSREMRLLMLGLDAAGKTSKAKSGSS